MESRITIRLFVDEVDLPKAAAFAEILRERLAPTVDVIQSETKTYWKIPEWSQVFLVAQPFAETKPSSAFHSVLAGLGEGWQRGKAHPDDSQQWAVWTPKAGCCFFHQSVRWANVELFPLPQQEH
jgi:hypothetical protein